MMPMVTPTCVASQNHELWAVAGTGDFGFGGGALFGTIINLKTK